MSESPTAAFISYSREDSDFALRLARDLKEAGASVWIDQLDIRPGAPWDNAIENALLGSPQMLVVLSPASSRSPNVRNEISFALDQGKIVVPVIYKDCIVPLQLQRNNRIDFRADYARGLSALLEHLRVTHPNRAVIDKAEEEESVRKTAWQAREAESRRLVELAERQEDDARQKETAERAAIEEADRKAREEAQRKAREEEARKVAEAAEQKSRDEVARKAAQADALRRESEDRKRREQEQQLQKEAQEQKAREQAEQKEPKEAERKLRDAAARKAREEAQRKAGQGNAKPEAMPELLLRNPKLLAAAGVVACIALVWYIYTHHSSSYAGVKWNSRVSGTSELLNAIAGSNDGRILYTCGTSSTILKSPDGGTTWKKQSPSTSTDCSSIAASADGVHVWVPGMYLDSVESNDGGVTWNDIDTRSRPDPTPLTLYDGISGIFAPSDGSRVWEAQLIYNSPSQSMIVSSSDGGATWSSRTGLPGAGLFAVPGADLDTFQITVPGAKPKRTGIPRDRLSAISGSTDGSFLIAIGGKGVIHVSDNAGADWHSETTGTQSDLHSVFVSAHANLLCAVGEFGTVIESTDKGASWTTRPSGTAAYLFGVFGSNDGKHLWAVGNSGTIIESDDSGGTWKPRNSETKSNLRAIFGTPDGNHLWVAGANGTILESKSGFY